MAPVFYEFDVNNLMSPYTPAALLNNALGLFHEIQYGVGEGLSNCHAKGFWTIEASWVGSNAEAQPPRSQVQNCDKQGLKSAENPATGLDNSTA